MDGDGDVEHSMVDGDKGSRGSGSRGGRGDRLQTNEEVPSTSIPMSVVDSDHIEPDDFYPLRVPGPHLPEHVD